MQNTLPSNDVKDTILSPRIVIKALHKSKATVSNTKARAQDILVCELFTEALSFVSKKTYEEVMDLASSVFGSESISTAISEDFQINYSCLLSNIARNSPTIGDAIRYFCSYCFLLGNVELHIEITESACKISTLSESQSTNGIGDQIEAEAILTYLIVLVRTISGFNISPIKAVLSSCIRKSQGELVSNIFGDEIETSGAGGNTIWFAKSAMNSPVIKPNAGCLKLLLLRAEHISYSLVRSNSVSEQTMKLMRECNQSAGPNLKEISDQLKMSPRSLQRRLKEEQTTFHELVDRTRFERAVLKLEQRNRDVASISVELGYKNLPSFYSAFKRWSGTTPKNYINNIELAR